MIAACLGPTAVVEDQVRLVVEEGGLGRHKAKHHSKLGNDKARFITKKVASTLQKI